MAMKIISVADIGDFKLGNAENSEKGTGCTVIVCEEGAVGGVDVRGGAPATRETDLLRSENTVDAVNAVVISGGSAFGLESASGVMRELADRRIGFDVGDDIIVPIVCGASLYDLPIGDPKAFPDVYMGAQAVRNAYDGIFANGNHGAGTGASVGKLKGYDRAMKAGLGTFACSDGVVEVGAVAAVNAVGDIYNGAGNIIAGLRSEDGKTIYGTIKTLKGMVHDQIRQIDESTLFINRSDIEEALAAAARQYEQEVAAAEEDVPEEAPEEEPAEEPVEEVFEEPVQDEVPAEEFIPEDPVEEIFEAPAEEPIEETVEEYVSYEPAEEYVPEEHEEPVVELFEEPAQDEVPQEEFVPEQPVEEILEAPVEEPGLEEAPEEEPAEEYVPEEPVEEFVQEEPAEPVIELFEEPAQDEAPQEEFVPEQPVEEICETPAGEPAEDPAEEFFEEPAQEEAPAEEPAEEYVPEEPVEEFVPEEPVEEFFEEPAEEPVVLSREDMGYDITFNTTVSCLITNAALTKSQANKLASILHDAYARAIKPVHGTMDGDTVFVLSTGKQQVNFDAFAALATDIMQYAIIDGAMSAESAYGLPAARDM